MKEPEGPFLVNGGSNSSRLPGPSLDLEFAQLSDPGRHRAHNEDYLGYFQPATHAQARTHGWVFALADGVGGQDRGEVASQAAVEDLVSGFRAAPASEPLGPLLMRLVQEANQHVYEIGKNSSPGGTAIATTLVACGLRFDRVAVAHVGDSRCYLVRQGQAVALTRDHTVPQEQVRLGLMTAREARGASTRHLLSRSLGTDLFVNVETSEHQVLPGDVFALCCDGLHNSVESSELAAVAGTGADLNAAAERLVALANDRDGSDNISVQLIRVRSVERVGMYRGRPYKLR
ncbi:MAG TPA: protein phosphatase 2C domain-containing protein [Bryobacteraceae bacterium]|nr:protein phosphatase 2C domain-containing protein [Bryobacteraceae bacterium]